MKTTEIKFEDLQRTSKNWDSKTVNLMVFLKGYGNMFGGSNSAVHLVLHGDNSSTETGTIEVRGIMTSSNNIARGANGPNSCSAKYYKGVDNFDNLYECGTYDTKTIQVTGICGGAEDLMMKSLSCHKEWLIN